MGNRLRLSNRSKHRLGDAPVWGAMLVFRLARNSNVVISKRRIDITLVLD